jgi:HEAT repeat protein
MLAGVGIGQSLNDAGTNEPTRLAALEQNVAMLNRQLILDRLEDAAAGKRLRGVVDAAYFAQDDVEIASALLTRATSDRVDSVRTAAIDALGPGLKEPAVGNELMKLLENAESPLVQLALVDLVLRNGSQAQLQHLAQLANTGHLHPDLVKHVKNALGSDSV